ncbi:polysaccharide export outer membrane protein [Paraburkholderia phenoliruptrix]|nr:polysaccharide export outer membrane protein [Paraburkholderia phenoliruptrix]
MLMRRTVSIAASIWLAALSSACASAPLSDPDLAGSGKSSPEKTGVYSIKAIDSKLVLEQAKAAAAPTTLPASRFATPAEYVYRISGQDILGVTVWDHPELTDPGGNNPSVSESTAKSGASGLLQPYTSVLPSQAKPYGLTVDADGTIYFPFVGRVRAAGKTTGELRSELASSLIPYIRNPQLDVRVLSYRSQKIQVTGRVKTPGPLAITDVPLSLVDAVTRAGGITADADSRHVHLMRDGKQYVFDMMQVPGSDHATLNVILQGGDIINVPDGADNRIFVLGEVKMPATVHSPNIADALEQAGGILDSDASPREIYVIRSTKESGTRPDIYRLDMSQPGAALLSTQFRLQPLDVVYVSASTSTSFSRVLQQTLPTLHTIYVLDRTTR